MIRLRTIAALAAAGAALALYRLGRCQAWHGTDNGTARCVHDVNHLHDHQDRHGATWDDQGLRRRRTVTGIMLAHGAKPGVPS